MPTFSDILEASPDVLSDGAPSGQPDRTSPVAGATDFQSILEASPDLFPGRKAVPQREKRGVIGEAVHAAVSPIKALAKAPSLLTMSDDEWYQWLKEESAKEAATEPADGITGGAARIAGGLAGGVAEFAVAEAGGSAVAGPVGSVAAPALAFAGSGSVESARSAGLRALQEGKTKEEVVRISRNLAGVGAATGAGSALVFGGTGLIPKTASALARTAGTAGAGVVAGVGSQLAENIAEKKEGLDVSPTEGLLEQAIIMGLLPTVLHAKDLYRQARAVKDSAIAKTIQKSADEVAKQELAKADVSKSNPKTEREQALVNGLKNWKETQADDEWAKLLESELTEQELKVGTKPAEVVETPAVRRRRLALEQEKRDQERAKRPNVTGTTADQQVGAGQSVVDEVRSNELFTRADLQEHFRKTGARVPSNEEATDLLKKAWRREPEKPSAIDQILSTYREIPQPEEPKSISSTSNDASKMDTPPPAEPEPRNAVENRIIERHRQEAQAEFDAAVAAGDKPGIRMAQKRLMQVLKVQQAPTAPAKPAIVPKPDLPNVAGSKFRPEVPGTEAEAEKGISVIDEIKGSGAKTIADIQRLFPQAQLNREAARRLRDQAWGKQAEPEAKPKPPEPPEPAAETVEKPPPKPPVAPDKEVSPEKAKAGSDTGIDPGDKKPVVSSEPAKPETQKHPWEMTQTEWANSPEVKRAFKQGSTGSRTPERAHEEWVKRALREGKSVPPEVLADYPNLKPKEKNAVQPEAAQPVRDVLKKSESGAGEVSAAGPGAKDDARGSEEQRPEDVQASPPVGGPVKLGQWPENEWSYEHLKKLSMTERANRSRYLGLRDKGGLLEVSAKKIADRAKQRLDEVKAEAAKPKASEPPPAPEDKKPDPEWQVTVQAPQEFPGKGTVPGYIQIDKVTGGEKEWWSSNPEKLRQLGYEVPDFSKLPSGKYKLSEAVDKSKETPPLATEAKRIEPTPAAAEKPIQYPSDSKGRSPERQKQLDDMHKKVREATQQQGALEKPAAPAPANEVAPSTQKKGFDAKQAKAQKKFLLGEIEKATAEAPDKAPKVEADDDQKIVDGVQSWKSGDTKETFEKRREEELSPLFEKYGVPEKFGAKERAVLGRKLETSSHMEVRMALLQSAIARAKFEQLPKIVIEVPHDGVFTIINSKEALKDFKERAKKFPTSAPKQKQPGFSREGETKPAAKGEPSKEAITKAASLFVSSDEARSGGVQNVWSDGKQTVATNGRALIRIKKGIGGTPEKPLVISPEGKVWDALIHSTDKEGKTSTSTDKYPTWTQVMPKESEMEVVAKGLDADRLFNIFTQANQATSEKAVSVKIWKNTDGSIGLSSESPPGLRMGEEPGMSYSHNVQDGAKTVMAVDPKYVIDALNAARMVGDNKITMMAHSTDMELAPLKLKTDNTESVIMPMRLSAVPTGEGNTIEGARAEAEKAFGKLSDRVSFVHEPDNPSAAYTDRNKIVVNAAKVAPGTVEKVMLEEGLHGVWNEPAVQDAWKEFRNTVSEYEIAAERAKRKGLDTSRETLKEEAAIAKLLAKPDVPLAKRIWDTVVAVMDKLFGVKVPNDRTRLLEAAQSFLTSPEGDLSRLATLLESKASERVKYGVHMDLGENPESRVESIMKEGLRSGQMNDITKDGKLGYLEMPMSGPRGVKAGDIGYLVKAKGLYVPKGEKPIAAIRFTRDGQSVFEAMREQGVRFAAPTTGKAPIEQYTDELKKIEAAPVSLREKFKQAFEMGQRLSAAKDTASAAFSGLKATGDRLVKKFEGINTIDDLLRAKGELSGSTETRGWQTYQWVKWAKKAVPRTADQAAIRKWVDAGGDAAKLQEGARETKPEFRRAYEDAQNLSPENLKIAQEARKYFEAKLDEAISAGVLEDGLTDYIHRIYENHPAQRDRAVAYVQSGILRANPSLAKHRVFDFDWQAEKEGYKPVQSFIPAIAEYETSLSRAIAARKFIAKANEMMAPDNRPIIDIKGVGIPIKDADGERTGTLIKPQFNPAKANTPGTANYRGDYVTREFPALQRWKWVGADSDDKPIFVQGDVSIHPDYVHRIVSLLEPSRVRYGRLGSIMRPALAISSAFKQTMLDLSGFHQVQIAVHAVEHKVNPFNLVKDIDFENENVQGLLKGGVTIGGDYHYSGEGLFGGSLTRQIPVLGPLAESYHNWLFRDFIPRVKMTMALKALERNRERYAGKLSEEQIFNKTAMQANSAFGGLNYTMLERSKTAQDIARLIMLAPDFLEARGRFAAEALSRGGKRFGNEQRTALLLGALTMYTAARVLNKVTDDQYHFEAENAFSWVINGQAYGLRTVQGDILHLLEKPLQFWMHRLNPVFGRTALEVGTQRDEFGRKRSFPEIVWDSASNIMPISLRSSRERSLWESLANGFGITDRRWQDTDKAFSLAKKWKDKHGIGERGEFIYDPDKDPLRRLKIALSRSDDSGAASEIKKLVDDKTYSLERLDQYFARYGTMAFTGSRANDRKFMADLSADEKITVEAAKQHKEMIRKLYQRARGQYRQAVAQ